ncbi:CHAT domain-containing protein [Leptolyngbya cf. ectocarpi LEGE 11479]|uniref:CHAT domain-containing protein n=1 Tax=Leptolyngbya cf. ectocarpi LEGE 11479 TaxID=1828722 RepID=A0A928X0W9_LEPEC|nr:CHAT domain-containing protein [Leptolyngbya ectocarpi]MBE9066907.1 CHAT domain-containing protein [Leptolyngbya cf. ectocarpi LEGE 11479]
MFRLSYRHWLVWAAVLLSPMGGAIAAHAQSITTADPATSIQQTDNLYQINGGNLSVDSATLFHNFGQFGLLTGETATFTNPAAVNSIIGRVTGGDASIIDGLLSVGGNADLYLLNPAGVLFGDNAQLNLGGSFSASTATGLMFGDELFDVLGGNNATLFNGAPTGYVFGSDQASAVINTGNLAVSPGQSLTLLGGQVVNTGQLLAPGGEVLVMAVPGENLVRLSQTGSLLGLELEPLLSEQALPNSAVSLSTIPALLTGAGDLGLATDIVVNPDGTVSLSDSSLQVPVASGSAIVSGQVNATGSLGGNIGILGDQIALVDAAVEASGNTGGGTVLIGGDRLGAGSVPNASATVIDETSVVRADGQEGGKIVAWGTDLLRSAGQLSARGGTGDGGFIETSSLGLLEVSTTPDISATNGAGGLWLLDPTNISIVAGNGATNISGGNPFIVDSAEDATLGVEKIRTALTRGTNVTIQTAGTGSGDGNITLKTKLDFNGTGTSSLSFIADGAITLLADILDSDKTSDDSLNLNFTSAGAISATGNIDTNGGDVALTSSQAGINVRDISTDNIRREATIEGDVSLQARTDISTNNINTFSYSRGLTRGRGGNVILNSTEGAIDTADIATVDEVTVAGSFSSSVTLTARGPISVNNIYGSYILSGVPGSEILLQSQASISAGDILNSSGTQGGNVTLKAENDIVFSLIDTESFFEVAGGNVVIESLQGNIRGTSDGLFEERTISTPGFFDGGTISISHNGGLITPFEVGDSSVNGTAGSISTGETTLENESFLGSITRSNIQINATENPIIVVPPETPIGPVIPPDRMPGINPGTVPITTPETPPPIEAAELLTQLPAELTTCISDCGTADKPDSAGQAPTGGYTLLSAPEIALQRFEEKLTTEVVDYLSPGLSDADNEIAEKGQDTSTQGSSFQSVDATDLITAQANLLKVQGQTGKRPALIYAVFGAGDALSESNTDFENNVLQAATPTDRLELLLVTAEGTPKYIQLPATRSEVLKLAQRMRRQVSSPSRIGTQTYLEPAQALYQILIAPLEAELAAQDIDTISFITDAGLRSVPIAALHDGEDFIIQNYNVGLMPSLSLTDLTYQNIRNTSALIAGTSAFADQVTLPGVPVELGAISSQWESKVLQGDTFKLDQFRDERQGNPYGIIHLATHGEFNVGDLSQSYLHMHNEKIGLDQLRTLGLHRPSVELLTLSACQTALGNRSAELGFAGFAVLTGAKTSVASLWSVSDEASAGLMIEFYRQLQAGQPTIKAEALRRAQLAMINGDVSVEENQLKGIEQAWDLPEEFAIADQQDFTHPYYWAAFTLVGSPW